MVDFNKYESKAMLSVGADSTRPELQTVYQKLVYDTLSRNDTLYRMVPHETSQGDQANWTVLGGRNSAIGSDAEIGTLISSHSTRYKLTTPMKIVRGVVEVSDYEIAAQRAIGISEVDIFTQEVQNTTDDLITTATTGVDAQMFLDGTGNGGLDLTGLKAWIDDSSATTSSVTTLAGLARSGYTFLNAGYTNTTSEAISESRLRTMFDTLHDDSNSRKEDLVLITTSAVRSAILGLESSAQRIMNNQPVFGFAPGTLPTFDGVPIYAAGNCEAGKVYCLNSKFVAMPTLQEITFKDLAKTGTSRKAEVEGFMEFVVKAPNKCGLLTGKY